MCTGFDAPRETTLLGQSITLGKTDDILSVRDAAGTDFPVIERYGQL